MTEISRRRVLMLGGVLAGAAAASSMTGCASIATDQSTAPATVARPSGGGQAAGQAPPDVRRLDGILDTARWPGQAVHWIMALPPGARGLVIALHGHGGNASNWFEGIDGAAAARDTGLALASVDGGDFYWHARRSGIDTGAMVLNDLIPELGRHGAPTHRIGFTGLSMGGYGALLLATKVPSAQLIGVATMSAALWVRPGDSAPGAFDDREDFLANDVFAPSRVKVLSGVPVSLACGTSDPFIAGNRALARVLPKAKTTFDAGGHDGSYWAAHFPACMQFLAAAAGS